MKKNLILNIFLLLLIVVLASFSIYAAFVITNSYEANIGYHQIENATLTTDSDTLSVTFEEPGDSVEYTYTLANSDEESYSYYYSISLVDQDGNTINADSKLLNMVYVYKNDEFCDVLAKYTYGDGLSAENLPGNDFIFKGESRSTKFKFELHNAAEGFTEETIYLKLTCNVLNINVQKYLLVNDEDSLVKVIADVNRSVNKTIVLASDITTTLSYEFTSDCTIDLCGHSFVLGNDIIVGANLTIIDSRDEGNSGGSNFILNDTNAFIYLETNISNIEIENYNAEALFLCISDRIENQKEIICGSEYDILGYYSVYNPTITSDDVTITNGIIEDQSTSLDDNIVISFSVNINDTTNNYELKYYGNSDILTDIKETYLKHLDQFITIDNGIQLTSNIFLPTIIKEHNVTISWFSSDNTILSNDGIAGTNQGNITLTATLKLYDQIYVFDYYMYVVQQDNLTKLQYLAGQIEQGTTLVIDGTETFVNVELDTINEKKVLPVAGEDFKENYNYYTNWTDGKYLGIEELYYEIEGSYYYLSTEITTIDGEGHILVGEIMSDASIYLNQVTFSKVARMKIIGYFDNGDVEETYITVSINLSASDLAEEVFDDVQAYLNSVNVLENILSTRAEVGVLNESGDFELLTKIDTVTINYESLNTNLYEIVEEDGVTYVHFIDLSYLALTNSSIKIRANIEVGEDDPTAVSAYKDLLFTVPGAVTTKNFTYKDSEGNTVSIFNMGNESKYIFYSIKLQVLQQSTENPLYSENIDLSSITELSDVYALGEYILIYDLEGAENLIFEYGDEIVVVDYFDLTTLTAIFDWATSTNQTLVSSMSFSDYVESGIHWIESDGENTLSDAEITIITSYCQRYSGFVDMWDEYINTLDNTLSESDINKLLETLASDKYYIAILNWIRSSESCDLATWLVLLDSSSPAYNPSVTEVGDSDIKLIIKETELPEEFIIDINNGASSISDDEERIIVYYVLVNHQDKYVNFYSTWKNTIIRQFDESTSIVDSTTTSNFVEFTTYTVYSGNSYVVTQGTNNNVNTCIDPVFAKIMEWQIHCANSDPGEALSDYLTSSFEQQFFSETELATESYWYYGTYGFLGLSNARGDAISENEWTIICNYLKTYYGITTITYNSTEYTLSEIDVTNVDGIVVTTIKNPNTETDHTILSPDFNNALIELVNRKYVVNDYTNFNNLITWATSTDLELAQVNSIITNDYEIALIDDYRIKDCIANISYDEYIVLSELLNHILNTIFVNDDAKTWWYGYYISNLDLNMSNDMISDTNYKTILKTIDDTLTFETIIEAITSLYKGDTPTDLDDYNSEYDYLSTISASEIKVLAEAFKDNSSYIAVINDVIEAYSVSVADDVVSVSVIEDGVDRTLDESEIESLIALIEEEIEKDTSSVFKYLTISHIDDSLVNIFEILKYTSNLKTLVIRGNASYYLFEDNSSANNTLKVIINSVSTLEALRMNYCGVSDISAISNALNLSYLDLRGNISFDGYAGISNLSPLIALLDNKSIANSNGGDYPDLLYLNVYNTDSLFNYNVIIFATIYNKNNAAEIWYEYNGVETLYSPGTFPTDEAYAINLCALLYDINQMGDILILPSKVFDEAHTDGVDVVWKIVVANSLIKYDSTNNRIVKIGTGSGNATISASITIGDYTSTRYFIINVQ